MKDFQKVFFSYDKSEKIIINNISLDINFGEAIGIGFQVRDDFLNLTEKSEKEPPRSGEGGYGKERGGDIAEGKRTLITIELLKRLPESDAERVRQILLAEREQVSESDIEWCISLAESTGALEAAESFCQKQAGRALLALKKLPDHPAKEILGELIDYLTLERKA